MLSRNDLIASFARPRLAAQPAQVYPRPKADGEGLCLDCACARGQSPFLSMICPSAMCEASPSMLHAHGLPEGSQTLTDSCPSHVYASMVQ